MHYATATVVHAPPQHVQALPRANELRRARARLKRDVGKGAVTVAEVILDSPWEARSMTIAELLTSQHRWGTARCNKFLSGVGISETKTVESMTERQRCLLARMVAPHPD